MRRTAGRDKEGARWRARRLEPFSLTNSCSDAEEPFSGLWLTLAHALRIFLRQSLKERRIPFLLDVDNITSGRCGQSKRFNAEKASRPFCSAAELMTDLNADEQAQCLGRNKCTAKQRGSMGGLNGRLRGSRWTQRPSTERFFPDFHKRYILSCRLLLVFTSAMRSELHGIGIVEHPAICRADNKMCQLKASRGVVTSALSLRRPKEQHYFPLVLARANWRRVTT